MSNFGHVFTRKSAYHVASLPLSPKNFVGTFLTGFSFDIILSH